VAGILRFARIRGRWFAAAAASVAAVGLVTAVIFALKPVAPVLSLGVLYLFAVLPVAAFWGLPLAIAVSLLSMTVFNWLFLPPTHTFRLADSENWVALAVYLLTAVSVSGLAARARSRAAEAERRQREAGLAAEVSTILLESREVRAQLPEIAARVAGLLGASAARIELDPTRQEASEHAYDLAAGERHVGRLVLEPPVEPDGDVMARLRPMLASLLATAIDREQVRRSDAAKTAVLRSVSHDLRSPITAIMTASDVLENAAESVSPEERDELLASIRLQGRRLERAVGNLLDLSRLEAGAATPAPELWTVDGLVARALEAIGPENERVDVSTPYDLPPVQVDPTQLEHVLVNLLDNALKFSPPIDRIEVRAEQQDEDVILRVIDRGHGIPRHEHDRIFEAFSHGASSDGSGLGLAIARGFAQVNGGRLWVESEPGRGSTFALALPGADVPEMAST
jgi:two-component system, OmpR family, sensor histidine kinase KdpD